MIAFFCIIDSWFVKGPGIGLLWRVQIIRRTSGRLFQTRQITLQENRRGNAVDNPLSLPAADIRRNQQIFRRTGRHPLIPGNDRNRERRLQ